MKEDLRSKVSNFLLTNDGAERGRDVPDRFHGKSSNLTEQKFHIDATFDRIRENGFWNDGEQIEKSWWFKNSDFKTNASDSQTPDQVLFFRQLPPFDSVSGLGTL